MRSSLAFVLVLAAAPAFAQDRAAPPACRLDDAARLQVANTVHRAVAAYASMGKDLGVKVIQVNPAVRSDENGSLAVFVVKDAAVGKVTGAGCVTASAAAGEALDPISVRGGCAVSAIDRMEIRCSSGAVAVFGATVAGRAENPSLLYVLSHELGHILQRKAGRYASGTERIDLKADVASKVGALRDACDPVSHKIEEAADADALAVMTRLLADPPYREAVLSERGSLYSNIDRIALASDAWRKRVIEVEAAAPPKLHGSFRPTEFPTPAATIAKNARRFVCDVMTKSKGFVEYPGRSATHPPPEQRLSRVAEALRSVAERLPATGAAPDFASIAKLQQDVGPILTMIYRETGVYLEAVQSDICSIVNRPDFAKACPK